jgi:hypothetical protein
LIDPRRIAMAYHPATARLPSREESLSPFALARWAEALAAGRARAPRCERILRNGQQCRGFPMREARKMGVLLCRWHCRGRVRDTVDARREPRLRALANSDNDILRSRAERSLACIARRKTSRAWKLDPRLPGSTVPHLSDRDAARVERWLAERNLRHGCALQATGRPPAPRCWDRMTWAAILAIGGRIDEHGAKRRLELAVKDEAAFWKRLKERGEDVE